MRARHVLPLLAMRRTKNGSGLDRWRGPVERRLRGSNQLRHCSLVPVTALVGLVWEDKVPKSSYDKIASEYYDARHITSRNFDNATRAALNAHPFDVPDGLILELGAGRGRSAEFLRVDPSRVVQLDNSEVMLLLKEREPALLRVYADACCIPLASQQFGAVTGFLADPFIGLQSLCEANRMLVQGGRLLLTVPTAQWGFTLRQHLGIDEMTTRFKMVDREEHVILPSLLHTPDHIREILVLAGFKDIEIHDQCVPDNEDPVSPDIIVVLRILHTDRSHLPVIHLIRARRS